MYIDFIYYVNYLPTVSFNLKPGVAKNQENVWFWPDIFESEPIERIFSFLILIGDKPLCCLWSSGLFEQYNIRVKIMYNKWVFTLYKIG